MGNTCGAQDLPLATRSRLCEFVVVGNLGLKSRVRSALDHWHGFRRVHLDGSTLQVLPYDKSFWDGVDAGRWENETLRALASVLGPGKRYCDIGAWIGPTVLAAHRRGAEIFCFEPDPLAYERLLGNLRLNGALDVRSFQVALGAEDGVREMGAMVGSLGKSATSLLGAGAQHTVRVTGMTWDTACRVFSLPRFDMIKMDVEGGEVELLPGMLDYLREHKPVLLLSTHWSFLTEEKRKILCNSLAALAALYPDAVALSGPSRGPVDLRDPLTPSHQSIFLLRPDRNAR